MTRLLRWILGAGLCLVVASTAAQAQVITGTVRDDSGAVMPGVTVEVSSPALIEKVRSAVTDGTGQFRILNLSAGTYTVTFTLPGFSTVKREGIELTGDFTANVNADLTINTPGQSGQPESPFYGNLLPLWANDEYFQMAFSL